MNLGYCNLYRCWLILSQRLCFKHTPTDLQHPIYSHRRRFFRNCTAGSVDVSWASIHFSLEAHIAEKKALRIAEIASGIVCGCLPNLPQFFRRYVPRVRKSLTSSFRSKSLSKSSTSNTPKSSRARASTQALVKGSYVELDENVHSKTSMGGPEAGYSRRHEDDRP